MADKKLYQSYTLGSLTLKNHAVMAPMTRSRAMEQNKANALMATYYQQRAGAGLVAVRTIGNGDRFAALISEHHVRVGAVEVEHPAAAAGVKDALIHCNPPGFR